MAQLARDTAVYQASDPPELLDALRAALVQVDASNRILFANTAACALFGIAGDQDDWEDALFGAERAGRIDGAVARLLTGAPAGLRSSLRTRDGRQFMLAVASLADAGRLIELTDISEPMLLAQAGQLDALTGLPNRLGVDARLAEALRAAPAGMAVLMLDLDRFKAVNDTLGHAVGDALLKLVVERMGKLIGPGDTLGRLGGDEFAVVCPRPTTEEVLHLADRLVEFLGRAYLVRGHMVNIGASVGIAFAGGESIEPESLIRRADLALFQAKAEGRNGFRAFSPELDVQLQERRRLEMALRKGLALREFWVAYQPQVDLATDRIVGFEALLRWTHDGETISPAKFVPLAEEIGLIGAIGEWVLRTACREAAQWPDHVGISVNLSPLQFRAGAQLLGIVTSALAGAGLRPERLELEITEGALLLNTDVVVSTLNALHELGVKIAMDDFGTGYASLSYLQKFPFDKIKIDQSFVRGMVDNQDSAAIVRAVAALGRSLGMTTIAEGVETLEQLDRIRDHGCAVVQGYLTGRPLPPDQAAALLARNQTR